MTAMLCGCHVSQPNRLSLTALYDRGDYAGAALQIEELKQHRDAELRILAIDEAVIQLMAGRSTDVLRELEVVRREMDYMSQQDVTEQVQAALKDDNSVAWSGREFESRMVDNLQLIAALVGEDDDAFALATRVLQDIHASDRSGFEFGLQVESDENGTVAKTAEIPRQRDSDRLATWLAAAVHSERIQDTDLTDRLIQRVAHWSPAVTDQSAMIQTLGTRSQKGMGTLQVVTFAGRVTGWESERAVPTSTALLIADRTLSAVGDHTLPPTLSPVRIGRPVCRKATSPFRTRVIVGSDTANSATSETLLDLNQAAWTSYQQERDQQIARAVVRRIVKKGAVYGIKDSLDVERESGADVLLNVAGGVWESLEQADLRHCRLLPASVEIAQIELPAGEHQVRLQVITDNAEAKADSFDELQLPVTIHDARNTFVICFRPQTRLVAVQTPARHK